MLQAQLMQVKAQLAYQASSSTLPPAANGGSDGDRLLMQQVMGLSGRRTPETGKVDPTNRPVMMAMGVGGSGCLFAMLGSLQMELHVGLGLVGLRHIVGDLLLFFGGGLVASCFFIFAFSFASWRVISVKLLTGGLLACLYVR
ncbi:hypothetical protein ZIOFF_069171 [Zingiber officinale]|uniref:Uncharacterized protein n=1 Tax=Zingiber officinale TaxID=94328 RepID=A0A8J5EPQ0_ZINOF|nr:hypothetical protein ZIOFF_069171 [Zingiber officinale]